MKNRTILGVAMILAVIATGRAFAQPEFKLSAGIGGYFTSDFGGGYEASMGGESMSVQTPYAGGGGFIFLDATFLELSLGFFGGSGDSKMEGGGEEMSFGMTNTGLDIGLLGKYPIAISDQLSVFPLLGINYRVILSIKNEDGEEADDPGDLSALWFKFGGGMDYSFTDSIYLRAGILYGLRLANKSENDMKDMVAESPGVDFKTLLGHGLEIKLAIGFKF